MRSGVRSVLAVLGGVVVSVIVVMAVDALVHRVFPLPPGTALNDRDSMREAMAVMPLGAFLLMLTGWTVAAAAGGYTAARLAQRKPGMLGGIVVGFLLMSTLANLAMLPHPIWMWPAATVLILAAGSAAARAGARRSAAVGAPAVTAGAPAAPGP